MAILKHIASKNADYGEAERYLIFQHDEYTQKPILDENGHMLIFIRTNLTMISSHTTISSASILKTGTNMD